MGDRCYVSVYCRAEDADAFEGLLDEERGEDGGLTFLGQSDVNYAYGVDDGQHGDLPKGIPFIGENSAGGDYPAAEFATDGITMRIVSMDGHGGYSVQAAGGTPERVTTASVRRLNEFFKFREQVRQMLKQPAPPLSMPRPMSWSEMGVCIWPGWHFGQ